MYIHKDPGKPQFSGILQVKIFERNESALGELGSATCGLQTVLLVNEIGKSIGITCFFGLAFSVSPSVSPPQNCLPGHFWDEICLVVLIIWGLKFFLIVDIFLEKR